MRKLPIRPRTFPVLLLCLALPVGAAAQAEPEPVFPKLTPKLQDLLRREMISLEDASRQILSALIAGDDARVAELAEQVHDSFILQQEMTPEDKVDLMAAVPEDFVQLDRRFHELSADLASAAGSGDLISQHESFGQMLEACTTCHSRYATDRFPGFAE